LKEKLPAPLFGKQPFLLL